MWRRELIRLVLAANWIVFAIASNGAIYGHAHLWGSNCWRMAEEDIPFPDGEQEDTEAIREAQFERRTLYMARTKWVGDSGQFGWWMVWGASLGTAVLLMIAFPKKPTSAE
jgi:hypothetical protein